MEVLTSRACRRNFQKSRDATECRTLSDGKVNGLRDTWLQDNPLQNGNPLLTTVLGHVSHKLTPSGLAFKLRLLH